MKASSWVLRALQPFGGPGVRILLALFAIILSAGRLGVLPANPHVMFVPDSIYGYALLASAIGLLATYRRRMLIHGRLAAALAATSFFSYGLDILPGRISALLLLVMFVGALGEAGSLHDY